ncbi:FRG domain-containing protein [Enterococcus hulanensis]|uniref:FRG domain-containing protein n=1 Tax=Enterococcus hulanensis TaxID=2559929 RepID=UPI00289194A0|nr:FRG domain-containing protein [Enterococcus hulanensis]MDT2661149.1 FRG domain-containing protein [Enterococcus hulanensis]
MEESNDVENTEEKVWEKLKEKEEIIEIDSVHQFIEKVHGFTQKESKSSFFYRGEGTLFKTSLPSIFRNKGLFENEKKITNDAMSAGAKDLKRENTNFDIISKIQHHKGITRMLDVTTNALTALFFASSTAEIDGDMGSVQVYFSTDDGTKKFEDNYDHIKEARIKSFTSDTAEVLSTLAFLTTDEKEDLTKDAYVKIGKDENERIFQSNAARQLLGEVRRRIPAFEDRIIPIDLFRPIFVIPSQNDERITRQDGAFLVIGLDIVHEANVHEKKLSYYETQKKYTQEVFESLRVKEDDKPVRFLITSKKVKKKLQNELASLGIHAGKIYADLDHISEYLKSKYSE